MCCHQMRIFVPVFLAQRLPQSFRPLPVACKSPVSSSTSDLGLDRPECAWTCHDSRHPFGVHSVPGLLTDLPHAYPVVSATTYYLAWTTLRSCRRPCCNYSLYATTAFSRASWKVSPNPSTRRPGFCSIPMLTGGVFGSPCHTRARGPRRARAERLAWE